MSSSGGGTRAVTLITGASGGIGADLARVFARHGHDLALVARGTQKLEALAAEIEAGGHRRPIVITQDLAARDAPAHIAEALAISGARVAILVNNAGFGLAGPVARLDPREQVEIVDVNVRAVLDLTLAFLPEIIAARGKILNVASIVSFFPGPGMAVYYASKAFLSSFSRALGEELKGTGVTVTVLHPGLTATGFQARAGFGKVATLSRLKGASALSVAEAGYGALMAGRRAIVPGLANKLGTLILPLVPDALLLPIVAMAQRARL
jgi:short-subunit dehydrogenase